MTILRMTMILFLLLLGPLPPWYESSVTANWQSKAAAAAAPSSSLSWLHSFSFAFASVPLLSRYERTLYWIGSLFVMNTYHAIYLMWLDAPRCMGSVVTLIHQIPCMYDVPTSFVQEQTVALFVSSHPTILRTCVHWRPLSHTHKKKHPMKHSSHVQDFSRAQSRSRQKHPITPPPQKTSDHSKKITHRSQSKGSPTVLGIQTFSLSHGVSYRSLILTSRWYLQR